MSRLWIPKHKIIEPKKSILAPRSRIGGRYRLFATRVGRSTSRPLTGWFSNLITTQGLNRIGADVTNPNLFDRCAVGTGNTAPNAANTTLQTQVALNNTLLSNSSSILPSSPYTYSMFAVYRFNPGMGPVNIAEVGVGRESGGSLLVTSRALILDGGGSPTTVAVAADEYLDVAYECQHHPFLVDITDTVSIAGEDRDITVRWRSVASLNGWSTSTKGPSGGSSGSDVPKVWSGAIGAITSQPAGSSGDAATVTNATYSADTFQLAFDAEWGISVGNFVGGIDAVSIRTGRRTDLVPSASFGGMQIGIVPPILKESGDLLTLNFNTSWDDVVLP